MAIRRAVVRSTTHRRHARLIVIGSWLNAQLSRDRTRSRLKCTACSSCVRDREQTNVSHVYAVAFCPLAGNLLRRLYGTSRDCLAESGVTIRASLRLCQEKNSPPKMTRTTKFSCTCARRRRSRKHRAIRSNRGRCSPGFVHYPEQMTHCIRHRPTPWNASAVPQAVGAPKRQETRYLPRWGENEVAPHFVATVTFAPPFLTQSVERSGPLRMGQGPFWRAVREGCIGGARRKLPASPAAR
jgi:hypothetical protein